MTLFEAHVSRTHAAGVVYGHPVVDEPGPLNLHVPALPNMQRLAVVFESAIVQENTGRQGSTPQGNGESETHGRERRLLSISAARFVARQTAGRDHAVRVLYGKASAATNRINVSRNRYAFSRLLNRHSNSWR